MRMALLAVLLLATAGCTDDPERSSDNLRKGDEFFERHLYEEAQYYYDRIPDTSPEYASAQRRLETIDSLNAVALAVQHANADYRRIYILSESNTTDPSGTTPTHKLQLKNANPTWLKTIIVRFSYFNEDGDTIGTLTCPADAAMAPFSEDYFPGIMPGTLPSRFSTCKAEIISATFKE